LEKGGLFGFGAIDWTTCTAILFSHLLGVSFSLNYSDTRVPGADPQSAARNPSRCCLSFLIADCFFLSHTRYSISPSTLSFLIGASVTDTLDLQLQLLRWLSSSQTGHHASEIEIHKARCLYQDRR
jgi:hypothetical protein